MKAWHAEIKGWQQEWEAFTKPNFDIHATPIRPERIVADCQMVLPDDAILACDVGVNHNWYMQFWKARRPQTMLNSWGFSGMGFGAAGALGAKLAAPDRWSRSPATAASPWCRTCCAPRSNTTSRWCG